MKKENVNEKMSYKKRTRERMKENLSITLYKAFVNYSVTW